MVVQFLTNAFMVPYMAVRERLPQLDVRGKPPKEAPRPLASFSKLFGGVALFISAVSFYWLFQASSGAVSWLGHPIDPVAAGQMCTCQQRPVLAIFRCMLSRRCNRCPALWMNLAAVRTGQTQRNALHFSVSKERCSCKSRVEGA